MRGHGHRHFTPGKPQFTAYFNNPIIYIYPIFILSDMCIYRFDSTGISEYSENVAPCIHGRSYQIMHR